MGSRSILISAICVAASLAVACGTEDDSASNGASGAPSGHSGSTGKAGASGGDGKAGEGTAGGGDGKSGSGNGGSSTGDAAGEGGEAGTGTGTACTPFAPFVHGLIKDSTTDKAVPTAVNGVLFCDDPQDPAAFSDLF